MIALLTDLMACHQLQKSQAGKCFSLKAILWNCRYCAGAQKLLKYKILKDFSGLAGNVNVSYREIHCPPFSQIEKVVNSTQSYAILNQLFFFFLQRSQFQC